ncbi:hypothetical protein Cni_G02438 [Canna indica]|uniref:Uncharacterized protein n=1 Tax=Canna indica TaxID=4628 RepID=A0AAQ3JPF4_9LILI|nr:hypothetical protein Cni_G02438 [Canna indica]
MEGLSLIDVSLEDDRLLASSSPSLRSTDPSLSAVSEGSREKLMSQQMEQTLQLSKSEQTKSRSRRNYLQQSLDWDRDFFTSEGVLNPEELAIINSTFKRTAASSVPLTNSSLCDDSLEDLEVHLFENARATVQKTLETGEKAFGLENSIKKNNPERGGECPMDATLKKVEPSQNKKKSPIVPERHHGYQQTSMEVTVVANMGHDGITSSKTVSRPSKVSTKAATQQTMPAKTSFVPGNTHIRANNKKDKPGELVQKAAVTSKKNGGPSNVNSKPPQSSKSTLNMFSNSSYTANKEKTRMTSTSKITNLSSGSISSKSSSFGSIANKASSKTSRTGIVKSSGSSPASSTSSSTKFPLSISRTSSFGSLSSVSCSSAPLASDEASCSSLSSEGTDSDKALPLTSLTSGDRKVNSSRLRATKTSQNKHVTSRSSRGNHPTNSTNNSSEAKSSIPSGLKKNVGTSQQSKFSKATSGISKIDSVNKQSKIQHIKTATHKRSISCDSTKTQSSTTSTFLSRTSSTESLSFK